MLCHIIPQKCPSEEKDFQAENTQILHQLQSSLIDANVFIISSTFPSSPDPSTSSFYLRNARPPSDTSILEICSRRRRPSSEDQRCLAKMAGKIGKGILHHQGLSYIPEIIRAELTRGPLCYRDNSRTCCQEILWRPTVAPDIYQLEGSSWRFPLFSD